MSVSSPDDRTDASLVPSKADAPSLAQAERQTPPVYSPPELFVIGRAVDLVLSYSSGKYSDGYTGYYWER